jgi:hypothetical protein
MPVASCVAPSNGGHTWPPFGVGSIGGYPPMGWGSPMPHALVSSLFGHIGPAGGSSHLWQSNMANSWAGPWQADLVNFGSS